MESEDVYTLMMTNLEVNKTAKDEKDGVQQVDELARDFFQYIFQWK